MLVTAALAAPVLPAQNTRAAERPGSQQEYWAQIDEQDWDAAVAAAGKLVTAARAQAKQKPLALAAALSLLGDAQLQKSDYSGAEATYAEALGIVESHASSTSARLIAPLRGLGITLARTQRDQEAVPVLERALLITHRSHGLFDISQRDLLQQLAASLTRSGRAQEAERRMLYLLRVGERTYGNDDPRLSPLLCSVGNWYGEVGHFGNARAYYRHAIELIEKRQGANSLALVEPLRALASSYTLELLYSTLRRPTDRGRTPTDADGSSNDFSIMNPRHMDKNGEEALQQALRIVELQSTPPVATLTRILLQIGDWFQIKQQPQTALPYYRRAAFLIDSPRVDADDVAQAATAPPALSFPVRVFYPIPLLATRNLRLPADQIEETFVQVEFTVTREGSVENATVVDQNGSARQASATLQAVRGSRFRPKFIDGEPVDTPGMVDREVFRVRKASSEEPDT